MARTAVTLVSKLAVLFYTLAEDVQTLAEEAGLTWQWRKVEGAQVDEGNWEGDCDEVGFSLSLDLSIYLSPSLYARMWLSVCTLSWEA